MDTEELIRGYYNNTLTEEQKEEYHSRYNQEDSFRLQANEMEAEILAGREAGRTQLKEKFSQWEADADSIQPVEPATKSSALTGWLKYGIAAAILLAVGLYLILPKNQTEDLYSAYFTTYENYEYTTVRDQDTESLSARARAYQYYDDREYDKAIVAFTDLLVEEPKNIPYT
ncbi:MAG: hypothetical protein WBA74_04445, partial [Cyclobacteriaceae bacterium]